MLTGDGPAAAVLPRGDRAAGARVSIPFSAMVVETPVRRRFAQMFPLADMDAAVAYIREQLDVPVLSQRDLPKPALVKAFTADEVSCLFATSGFFQGVDVPGRTLSNQQMSVQGPLTRTVEDAALVLGVIAGYDPGDPLTPSTGFTLPSGGGGWDGGIAGTDAH